MEFLYVLEKLRVPGLNELMLLVTRLGEETAFLVLALIFFWCVDKKVGYYIMSVGFIGTMANQFMKLLFRIPRPWVLDENFTILEQAREAATGYSFPSGHTQNAVGTFGSIACTTKHRWLKVLSVIVMILVPFSRMYVGVHTPLDVGIAALMALALIFILKPATVSNKELGMKILIPTMLAMAIGLLIFVECYPFPTDVDEHNLQSGMKNAYTMLGCLVGVALVYILDRKYLNFSTDACWWAQIIKAILGLLVVLAVKELTRSPLEAIFGHVYIARAVRYFLVVLTAGFLWPMSFRFFAGLGNKEVKP